jgi:hypothetical protein
MMPDPPRYYSNASSAPRLRWDELPFAISVQASPDDPRPIGWANGDVWPRPADPPPEKVWRLCIGGEWLEGRYALRHSVFVELAEEA